MSDRQGARTRAGQDAEDTFPASDPPANSGITGAETSDKPSASSATPIETSPTGRRPPTGMRPETAHQMGDDRRKIVLRAALSIGLVRISDRQRCGCGVNSFIFAFMTKSPKFIFMSSATPFSQ